MSPAARLDMFFSKRRLNETPQQLLPNTDTIFLMPKLKINQ